MSTKNLKTELATDIAENEAVVSAEKKVAAAEAAIADTTDGGDAIIEAQNLANAKTQLDIALAAVDTKATIEAANNLSITDFCMVSNDMARAILKAKGVEVKFQEPEVVHSDYYMKPYTK